jgi:membrane-associated PAP2 superfamily phosphatase
MTRPQRHEVQAWLALSLICIMVYAVWPTLDLQVALWFYTPSVGFDADRWPWVPVWHMSVPWVGRLILVCSVLVWTLGRRFTTPATRRKALALTLCLIVGLWLIMHAGFKDNWGRARPSQVSALSGTQTYTSPLLPSTGCERNCSFMSGHAGTGFVLIAIGALATTRIRRRWLIIGWTAGLALGFIRMAQGGHFLGDVLFGGLLLWGCAWSTRWFYVHWRARRRFKTQP